MAKKITHELPRLLGKLKTLTGEPIAHLFAAVALTLAAVLWRATVAVRADPEFLIILPFLAILFASLAGILLCLGGAGWLVAQLLRLIIVWRAHDELREGMTRIQVVSVLAGVIFLGVPELTHAITWWQEHGLRLIPGEEAALDHIYEFYETHAETVNGLVVIAVLGCVVFWQLFTDFRTWLRRSADLIRGLLSHRDWRFPILLVIAMLGTGVLAARSDNELFIQLLSAESICLVVWLLLPIIVPNLVWLIGAAAIAGPSIIVADRLGGNGKLAYFTAFIVWGAWLFSIVVVKRKMWGAVYWLGVIGFLAYLVDEPGRHHFSLSVLG